MNVTDKNVFVVVGHTGPAPSDESMFVGHMVAADHVDAKNEMVSLFGDLTVVAVTSLEQMKLTVAGLERVKRGEAQAPVSERFARSA